MAQLKPDFGQRVKLWYSEVCLLHVTPYIYEGPRTLERQAKLFAMGRTAPGQAVTDHREGESFHNYSLAFDWVPLVREEKAYNMYRCDWENVNQYDLGQRIAKKHGLRTLVGETPHLEDSTYSCWQELRANALTFTNGRL